MIMLYCAPPAGGGGGTDERPDYAAMADTLERIAGELTAKGLETNDATLTARGKRLMAIAAEIRANLAR